jgi:hypothetical protein
MFSNTQRSPARQNCRRRSPNGVRNGLHESHSGAVRRLGVLRLRFHGEGARLASELGQNRRVDSSGLSPPIKTRQFSPNLFIPRDQPLSSSSNFPTQNPTKAIRKPDKTFERLGTAHTGAGGGPVSSSEKRAGTCWHPPTWGSKFQRTDKKLR